MKNRIIKNYINNLTHNDIDKFAIKNNILLNKKERDYIYNIIKNNYTDLLYGNENIIFKNLKNNINNQNYQKIVKLFFIYKEKYHHLL